MECEFVAENGESWCTESWTHLREFEAVDELDRGWVPGAHVPFVHAVELAARFYLHVRLAQDELPDSLREKRK